jgi:Flp pilus assembly pilin Flp
MQAPDDSRPLAAAADAPAEQPAAPDPASLPGARRRPACRRGATTMEYLVMLSFILLLVIVGVQSFGAHLSNLFKTSADATSQH